MSERILIIVWSITTERGSSTSDFQTASAQYALSAIPCSQEYAGTVIVTVFKNVYCDVRRSASLWCLLTAFRMRRRRAERGLVNLYTNKTNTTNPLWSSAELKVPA